MSEAKNKLSAMRSNERSRRSSFVRMEMNEKMQLKVSITAMMDVHASMILVSSRSAMLSAVSTKRQNPKRLAAVPSICCEVVLLN